MTTSPHGQIQETHHQLARTLNILLVEDSPSDVAMTRAALRQARVSNQLHLARDGDEAMRFLRREAPFTDVPRPDLVLLDLNLPRLDGREVLRELESDEDLKSIPVVVLTTSANAADIRASYRSAANAYVVKPVGYDELVHTIAVIEGFWLLCAYLPSEEAAGLPRATF